MTTELVDLGRGWPHSSLLPLSLVSKASNAVSSLHADILNYGDDWGEALFRSSLLQWLNSRREFTGIQALATEHVFITFGASGAIDMLCRSLLKDGDICFVEEPTYFYALHILRDHRVNIVSIKTDDEGIVVDDEFHQLCSKHAPKAIYMIPIHHNPSGVTTSLQRRKQLVQAAHRHGFMLFCDETYQLLNFDGFVPPQPMISIELELLESESTPLVPRVFSLGSFSKILAPGLRAGYILSRNSDVLSALGNSGLIQSGGNHSFVTAIIQNMMDDGSLDTHLSELQNILSMRRTVLAESLRSYCDNLLSFKVPLGGYFIWARLSDALPTSLEVKKECAAANLLITSGDAFYTEPGNGAQPHHSQFIRLCFAYNTNDNLVAGCKILGQVLQRLAKSN